MSFFNSPAQQLFLELSRAQGDLNQQRQEQLATPEMAAAMRAYSTLSPQGSSALGLALAQGGIPAGDPMAQQLVQQEMAQRQTNLGPIEKEGEGFWDDLGGIWSEAVYEPLKGTTRWAMSAWDAAYNMVAGGAPIRAMMLSSQTGESFGSAWQKQDPYFFEAIGGLIAGENVNLGSGFLPGSDVADDVSQYVQEGMQTVERDTQGLGTNEKYVARLEAAPGVWNQAVTQSAEQASMGRPLTELARVGNESVIFEVPRIGGGTSYTPWSPGRIGASTVFEPGSTGFKYASGTGDFLSQMFADPVEWTGFGWAKMGKAGRLLRSESFRVAEEIARATPPGIPDGTRALANDLKIRSGPYSNLDNPPPMYGPGRPPPQPGQAALPAQAVPSGLGVADEAGRAGVVQPQGRRTPWWRTTTEPETPLNAFDPPSWYVDMARKVRNRARGTMVADEGKKLTQRKRSAGWYEVDMPRIEGQPQKSMSIRKVGKGKKAYWDVTTPDGNKLRRITDDPRFEGDPGFRTMKEAQAAARKHAYGESENLKVNGMTPDEFEASGEDFYIQDGMVWLKDEVGVGPSPNETTKNLKRVNRKTPFDDRNMKIVVFGRSADLADRKVAGKPQGLIDALTRDHKIRGENIAGNPSVDSFTNTRRWMEENGYGKLDMGNDDVLIAEKYIGGDISDPGTRYFTEDPAKPMRSIDLGNNLETIDSVSADEVNAVIDMYARSGLDEAATEADKAIANRAVEVKNGETPPPELGGTRVDYDEEELLNTLKGKRADLFTKRLFATTAAAGQTNRAAMDKLLGFLNKQHINIPNEFRRALYEAPTEEAARAIFARLMTEQMGSQLLLPGGQYGRLASALPGAGKAPRVSTPDKVLWKDKPFLARRSAQMLPNRNVDMLNEPGDAYQTLEAILPNYNVRRGQEFIMEDGTVLKVEDAFDELMNLEPGNVNGAMDVMTKFSQIFFSSLVDDGVTPDLARRATNYWEQNKGIREYNTARIGKQNLKNGPVDGLVVDDYFIGGLDGAQITAQAWDGVMHFPDAHTTKVIANQTDALGRLANSITNKISVDDLDAQKIDRRAWNLFLTNAMNRVWKPFVLLRGAWTLRILMDDQLRVAADGYGAFNHPIRVLNYALSNPGDIKSAFTRGKVDVFGELIDIKNVDNLMHGDLYKRAMMAKGDPRVGGGSMGYKHRSSVGKDSPLYVRGQAGNVRLLRSDDITSALAGVDPKENAVEHVVQLLMGKGPEAGRAKWQTARTRLASYNKNLPEDVQRLIMTGDHDTIYKLVSHQDAMLRETVGGRVVFDDGAGGVRDYTQFKTVDDIESTNDGKQAWRVLDSGDQELLDIIAKKGKNKLKDDDSMKALEKSIKEKLDANPDRYPNFTTVSDSGRVADEATTKAEWDKAINIFYEWMMTRPSDKFSRSPLFRKSYWDKMGQLSNGMTPGRQAAIRRRAKAANAISEFDAGAKATRGVTGKLDDLEQADYLAKAHALMHVDKTLFDLVNKRNISDSLNLIFPFVEAWGEFISRWGRMMLTGDRNVANMRRMQQGVEGLRQDSGFFQENEYGQEVFNYPAFLKTGQIAVHNTLNNIPGVGSVLGGDIDAATAESISLQGNAESLNFASSFIPGFGPVFQLAARSIPDDPGFDFIRDIVAPYGTEGTISPFMPAWFKRIVSAHGGAGDPTLQYTWTSTVQDVMRVMMDEGKFAGVTSKEGVDALVKEAEDQARGLLMVRAAATWWVPASPSVQWHKEDVDGNVWSFSNLGEEYRKIQEELGGSETAAFDEFYRRFGFLPAPFARGDTYSIEDRSLSEEGNAYQRANAALFAKYPLSAMYLDPSIGAEGTYDHGAMIEQLERSQREQWTAEQMVYLQQDQYGDLQWDNANQMAMTKPKEARKAFLTSAREEITELYPFWGKQIPGKRQGARNDEQMAEVIAWTRDPDLAGTPIVAAVRRYLNERDTVLKHIKNAGASTIDGPKSQETQAGQIAQMGRQWLRDEAENLSMELPEFENIYRSVFFYEVSEDHDALPEIPAETTNAWGEGDILEQVLGVTSG